MRRIEGNLLYAERGTILVLEGQTVFFLGGGVSEDLDERMYRAVMYDPYPDYSRDEGLTGYGWYWLCRRANAGAVDCLSRIAARIEQDQAGFSPGEIRDTARFLHAYAGHPDPVGTLVETDWERLVGAGLMGGYAGAGLESLSSLGAVDTSWRLLL